MQRLIFHSQYFFIVHAFIIGTKQEDNQFILLQILRAAKLGIGGTEIFESIEKSVRRAGDAYFSLIHNEFLWGGPEDNDSATSEDGLNALIAYGDVYSYFGEDRYLESMDTCCRLDADISENL